MLIVKLPAEFSASAEEREALKEAGQQAHHDAEAEMQPKTDYMEYFSNGFIVFLSQIHHFMPFLIRISSENQLTWVNASPFVLV